MVRCYKILITEQKHYSSPVTKCDEGRNEAGTVMEKVAHSAL